MDNQQEIFPVIDEQGRVVGSATRGECHGGSKLLHPSSICMCSTPRAMSISSVVQSGKTSSPASGTQPSEAISTTAKPPSRLFSAKCAKNSARTSSPPTLNPNSPDSYYNREITNVMPLCYPLPHTGEQILKIYYA